MSAWARDSLRLRLLAGTLAWVLLSVLLAGWGLRALLREHITQQLQQQLVVQLVRKLARQLRGLPSAHSRQTGAQQLQRAQRQVQLQHHRQRQPQRQNGQRHAQQAGKALQRLGNQRLVARYHQAQGRGIVFGQLQRARHGQQGVALGAGQRQHLVALLGSLWRGHGHVKHLIPQRT